MDPLKVLFLGNSYTYGNKLPWMVSALAASAEPPGTIDVDMVAEGGVSLHWHGGNAASLEAIRRGGWDFVVLQDHSLGPIRHRDQMFEAGTKLHEEIRAVGAKTVLFLTWAREHLPEMQRLLNKAYKELAGKLGALLAPVGVAWHRALVAEPALPLFREDESHPTPTGSYLSACVFYATFTGLSPVGLTSVITVNGEELLRLDDDRARFLQTFAWKTVESVAP